MASVVIQGDTSGSVTLQAPAVAGSTTVNLPSTIGNAGTSAVVTTDASGNVGIGGVTPSAWGANNPAIQMGGTNQSSFVGTYATAFGTNAYFDGTNWKYIQTGGVPALYAQSYFGGHKWYTAPSGTAGNTITFTQAMTLDSSGNLGLGVTPSSWGTNTKAFQIAKGSWTGALASALTSDEIVLTRNAYFDSTNWRYVASSSNATLYQQSSAGQHLWSTAPSGTAGNAITFTQAMTLDASGRLGIGVTNPAVGLVVSYGTDGIIGNYYSSGGGNSRISFSNTSLLNNNVSIGSAVDAMVMYTNGSERARITSGGEFYVAGTTDQGAYNIQCNGTGVWGAGAYVNGSDARIKEEIQPIDSGLDVVQKFNPVTYKYKEDWTKDRSTQTGFIAQELLVALEGKNYVDGVVTQGGSEGYYSVAYQNIIPILTKAIQELNAKVEAQAAEIAALKAAGSN